MPILQVPIASGKQQNSTYVVSTAKWISAFSGFFAALRCSCRNFEHLPPDSHHSALQLSARILSTLPRRSALSASEQQS
ncbi:hypothetical protein BDN71DRAFT_992771 [Pleurotus eryngii]|uniref:Uncharacterized protein n=1 Tax=Pleurotus eryngii TaxID=5323 RepID=A0A9P6DFA7_PLEER|nr:hypothetical protein BDN71DRAFT_992771 [Pleurotus eryngii]